MAQVRGSAHVASTTAVMIMVVTMCMLFQTQVAEAAVKNVIWTTGTLYQPVNLKVNDTIRFNYSPANAHNVVPVSITGYNKCKPGNIGPLKSPSVTFTKAGTYYYICSLPGHCVANSKKTMRIQVTVT